MHGPTQALHQAGDEADSASKLIARLYRLSDRDPRA